MGGEFPNYDNLLGSSWDVRAGSPATLRCEHRELAKGFFIIRWKGNWIRRIKRDMWLLTTSPHSGSQELI